MSDTAQEGAEQAPEQEEPQPPASLNEALLRFQADAIQVSREETADTGTFKYKYLSLDKLLAEVLPKLSDLGLHWLTRPTTLADGASPALYYRLEHIASGECIEDTMSLMLKPGGGNPQDLGKALTYSRRYALVSVLQIGQPDDDGEVSTSQGGGSTTGVKRITKAKAAELLEAADRLPTDDRKLLQMAASHVRGGEDVGDCGTKAKALTALQRLDTGQAEKLAAWIKKKTAEALGEDA